MQYLADTNVLLWFISGDRRLPADIIDIIEYSQNEIYISITSAWEIAIKYRLKRIQLDVPFYHFFPGVIERNGFALSGISMEAVHLVSEMPYIHRDPFDRMIFAHAKSSQYRLLYTDPVFKKYEAYYHE